MIFPLCFMFKLECSDKALCIYIYIYLIYTHTNIVIYSPCHKYHSSDCCHKALSKTVFHSSWVVFLHHVPWGRAAGSSRAVSTERCWKGLQLSHSPLPVSSPCFSDGNKPLPDFRSTISCHCHNSQLSRNSWQCLTVQSA